MKRISDILPKLVCAYCSASGLRATGTELGRKKVAVAVLCPWCKGVDVLYIDEDEACQTT